MALLTTSAETHYICRFSLLKHRNKTFRCFAYITCNCIASDDINVLGCICNECADKCWLKIEQTKTQTYQTNNNIY